MVGDCVCVYVGVCGVYHDIKTLFGIKISIPIFYFQYYRKLEGDCIYIASKTKRKFLRHSLYSERYLLSQYIKEIYITTKVIYEQCFFVLFWSFTLTKERNHSCLSKECVELSVLLTFDSLVSDLQR